MKTVLKVAIIAAGVFSFSAGYGQTTGQKVSTTTKKVGHKISNVASNTESTVVDKKYDGKCGPQGQTVYINKHSHYYYIDKKGHRVYLKKSQLMDKPM